MKREKLSEAIGGIALGYVQEAAEAVPVRGRGVFPAVLSAAVLLGILLLGMVFLPWDGMDVTVYAQGADRALTTAGAVMQTGRILDSGEMVGQPLFFYLSGEGIETVRFTCRRQQLQFMDWTEQREEAYLCSQTLTVSYGPKTEDYYYLLFSWVPEQTIRALTDDPDMTIAALPAALREDAIRMEIRFQNGKTATMGIRIRLQEDGYFFAALEENADGTW